MIMKTLIAIPCSAWWTFRQVRNLYLWGLQSTEIMVAVQYPLKVQNYCSIVPRGIEKAGKKSLTSYPLFVATCMSATLFQLIVDAVL